MSLPSTILIRGKGGLTLPVELRRKYGLNEGDLLTIVDLGEGVLMLYPGVSEVNRSADRVERLLRESGVSIEEILTTLDEERESYYRERYVEGKNFSG